MPALRMTRWQWGTAAALGLTRLETRLIDFNDVDVTFVLDLFAFAGRKGKLCDTMVSMGRGW